MSSLRLPAVIAGLLLCATPALADSRPRSCLPKDAQREAVAAGQAMTLGRAIRLVRPKNKGDVVDARLCKGANGLVYVLTLLARNGKVTIATVDAANGHLLGGV